MAVIVCPILRHYPHREDCHYCPNFNYLEQVCQHDDAVLPTPPKVYYGKYLDFKDELEQQKAYINHLEKKMNEHLDYKRKPEKKIVSKGFEL